VAHPYYSIRIHKSDGKELSYAVGSKVFFVSNDSNLTYYVFSDHIEKYVLRMSNYHIMQRCVMILAYYSVGCKCCYNFVW